MSVQDGWYGFDNDFNRLHEAQKQNGVITGLAVSETSPVGMKVLVGTGEANVNSVRVKKTATTEVTISGADPTNPRKDIITLDDAGTLAAVTGTAQAAAPSGQTGPNTYEPKPPDIPANKIILAEVWVGAGVTAIYNADITNRRVFVKHQIRFDDLKASFSLGKAKTARFFHLFKTTRDWLSFADVPANRLYAIPFIVPRKMRFDSIGLYCRGAGASGAKGRLGIYNDDGNIAPSSLVLDAGEVDLTTVGAKTITINQTLEPGIYWLAYVGNDATVDLNNVILIPITGNTAPCERALLPYAPYTYGTFPSTFPSATWGDSAPVIEMKLAEVIE